MNSKYSADEQLKQAVLQYRNYVVPVGVIFVSLMLIITIIIPQIQSWFAMQKQVGENRQQLDLMNKNLQLVSSLDDQDLTSKLSLVTTALPADNDLYGIVTAINRAGISSGVIVGDYSFSGSTGVVSSGDNQSVTLSLVISGSIDTIRRFITEIKKQLPLADITEANIQGNGGGSVVNITFFYKDFPHLTFHNDQALDGLSASEQDMLNQLSDFEFDASAEANLTLP